MQYLTRELIQAKFNETKNTLEFYVIIPGLFLDSIHTL